MSQIKVKFSIEDNYEQSYVREQIGIQYKTNEGLISLNKRNFFKIRQMGTPKEKAKSRIPKVLYKKTFKLRSANDTM